MAVSEMGNLAAVAAVAVTAIAVQTPAYLGVVLAAQSLPVILLGRWIPRVIHNWGVSTWRILLLAQAAAFLVVAAFPTHLGLIIAGVTVVGIIEAFLLPFSRAVLSEVSGPDGAAGLARQWGVAKSFAGAAGFVVAGTLIQASSVSWVFLGNAATFVVLACASIAVPRLSTGRTLASPDRTTTEAPSLAQGFGELVRPEVFSTVGFVALGSVLLGTSLESVSGPFIVGGYSGYTPLTLAVTVAAWPVMSTVASLLLPSVWGTKRQSLIYGAGLIGAGLAWMSLAHSWTWGIVGFALAGAGNGIVNISLSAAIWGDVDAPLQRATWSAFNFTLAIMLIVGFTVGSLAGPAVSPRVVLTGGLITLVANVVYAVGLARRRRRRRRRPVST